VPDYGITLDDIHAAETALRGRVVRTPAIPAASLSDGNGRTVYLKLETLQPTGAFKLRGSTNKLLNLNEAEKARGVVTMSTGNHGRGVAFAARALGLRAVVCMSNLVPENKIETIRAAGAEVRIVGESQDEAEREVARLVEEESLTFVHPFDDPAVLAGQGTIGLELLEDLPAVDSVIVPLSGGGLIGGIAFVMKSMSPGARVIGVSMERGAAMIESIKAGHPVQVKEERSLADSLGGGIGHDNRYTFPIVRDLVDELIVVGEARIAEAMAHLYWRERLVTEGAAAVGVAVLLHDLARSLGETVAVIVSGQNVDMKAFTDVVLPYRPE
jgi:threonine dehydratase